MIHEGKIALDLSGNQNLALPSRDMQYNNVTHNSVPHDSVPAVVEDHADPPHRGPRRQPHRRRGR